MRSAEAQSSPPVAERNLARLALGGRVWQRKKIPAGQATFNPTGKQVWQLVGEPEADAKKGKISITSPLARALIGKSKGTSVEVVTPSGAKAYEIKKVEFR